MNLLHRDRLQNNLISLISVCLMRGLRQLWKNSSTRSQTSEKECRRADSDWTTPQRTRFRDVQHARIMATVWVDDDKTKSDYIKKKTWNCVCVVKLNGETSDTNDNVTTKINTKHMKLDNWRHEHVNVRIVLLVLFSLGSSHSFIAHHIAWLKLSACLSHLIHAWSERRSSTLPLHSIHLPTLIPHQPQAVPATLQLPRGQVVRSPVLLPSYLNTGYEPKDYFLTETYVECLTQSPRNRFSRPLAPATTCVTLSSPSLLHLLICAEVVSVRPPPLAQEMLQRGSVFQKDLTLAKVVQEVAGQDFPALHDLFPTFRITTL